MAQEEITQDIKVETRVDPKQFLETKKALKEQMNQLTKELQAAWVPVTKQAQNVGAAIKSGLGLPLTLAQKAAGAAKSALNNLFGSQLRQGIQQVGSAIMAAFAATGRMRGAVSDLKDAFAQMLSPLVQALTSALAGLVREFATVLAYAGRLFSFLTGKTVTGAEDTAQAVADVGTAAGKTAKKTEEATRSLADFDEITRLDAPKESGTGSGGGGGNAAEKPGWAAASPFLDQLLATIEGGEYERVGILLAA